MTATHKLGIFVAIALVAFSWGVALGKPGVSVGPAVGLTAGILVFGALLVVMERRKVGHPPDRQVIRPASWTPPKPSPSPLIGPHAWAAACFGNPAPTPSDGGMVTAVVVSDARRDAAPVARGLRVPERPAEALENHQRAVEALPHVLALWNPMEWPVCCGRAAVIWLVNPIATDLATLERACGPLDVCEETPG